MCVCVFCTHVHICFPSHVTQQKAIHTFITLTHFRSYLLSHTPLAQNQT